jgi:hypothetical protein
VETQVFAPLQFVPFFQIGNEGNDNKRGKRFRVIFRRSSAEIDGIAVWAIGARHDELVGCQGH